MTYAKEEKELKLVISIGANIPSKIGNPLNTIAAIRPLIEKSIKDWNILLNYSNTKNENLYNSLSFKWSPLFETDPLGGPTDQPDFINTVLVVDWNALSSIKPSQKAAIDLMKRFLELEKFVGRERRNNEIFWGPRCLDIDFISWGALQINTETLVLPHPRLSERNFVLVPLIEVLSKTQGKPRRIKSQEIWPE